MATVISLSLRELGMRALGRRLEHVRDDPSIPLCVKLEGAVLRTGTTGELALALVRRRPWMVFFLLAWALEGKEALRSRVVEEAAFDPSALAYRGPFLTYLRREAASGRPICLVARAKSGIARAISNYLGLFSDVIEIEANGEPSGETVAKTLCARFGSGDFDYAGHEHADLPVWRTARRSIIVAPSPRLLKNHLWSSQAADVLCPDDWISGRYAEALHPSRWFKNLLIFLPLFDAANRIDVRFVVSIYLAFCAYCLVASSGYIANDLADLNADRRHALKHRRPFASGRLAVAKGLALSLGLAALGLGLGFFLSPFLAGWLCLYLALSLAYSMWIKKTLVLDVFALTALSMHRVLTGTIMMGAAPSFWLVLFSGFLFFGLAVLGRYGELKSTRLWARRRATRALAYRSGDLDVLASFGLASSYLSVAILALFVLTADAHASFRTPEMLWLICPLLLYWIGRVWIFARRGKVPEDPLQFAIRDRPSIYVVAAALALLGVAVFVAVPLPAL